MTTRIEVKPVDAGRCSMKSMEMEFPQSFCDRKLLQKSIGVCGGGDFECMQVVQDLQNVCTKVRRLGPHIFLSY